MKRLLFFFGHPSKYHLFKYTINELKERGHQVDIIITSKDVLEDLVKQEGWEYTNLFPEGRRSKSPNAMAIIWATFVNAFKTLYRLQRYVRGKKYDLYITSDLLTVIGWLNGTPSIMFTDNELTTVPESALLLATATKVLAPASVHIGKYERKKIAFKGYKELAYLHPAYFKPDPQGIEKIFRNKDEKYFLLRVVSMTASHDRGLSGLTDDKVQQIIDILKPFGKVVISTERKLSAGLEQYRLKIDPEDILDVIYYASLFISDSGTMSSEAALLGTPALMFHNFIGRLGVMEEKEKKYGLMFGYDQNQFDVMLAKIRELVVTPGLKEKMKGNLESMLNDSEDLTATMIDLFENFRAK